MPKVHLFPRFANRTTSSFWSSVRPPPSVLRNPVEPTKYFRVEAALPAAHPKAGRPGHLQGRDPGLRAGGSRPLATLLLLPKPCSPEPWGGKGPASRAGGVEAPTNTKLCFSCRFPSPCLVLLHFCKGRAVSTGTFCLYGTVVFPQLCRQSERTQFPPFSSSEDL